MLVYTLYIYIYIYIYICIYVYIYIYIYTDDTPRSEFREIAVASFRCGRTETVDLMAAHR